MLVTSHSLRRRTTASAAAAAALVLLAACGGADSSSSQSTATGDAASQVAAAEEAMQPFVEPPAAIPVTTPLGTAPEPGKTFVFLKCDAGSCGELGKGFEEAVPAAGWEYREIAVKSADPATYAAALKQALQYDPAAVAMSGIPPEAGWASSIAEYEEAGVPIITSYLTTGVESEALIAGIGGPTDYETTGELMANWFIADSQGKGKAVLQRVDDFPIVKVWSDAFAKTVKENCSDCEIVDLNNTIPDVFAGKITQTSVSALRSNPDASYLVSSNAEFLEGLDAALSAAGLDGKITFAGSNASLAQLQELKDGRGAGKAYPGLALRYSSWSMVDVALRHEQDMEFETDNGGLPTQLLVSGGDFDVQQSYDKPADFQEQFKKLWQVG